MAALPQENLSDLLSDNKEVFFQELENVIKPTFTGLKEPEKYNEIVNMLAQKISRPLFARQARLASAAIEHLRREKSLIVSAEMGTGKCLHPDAQVVTENNVVRIEDMFMQFADLNSIQNDMSTPNAYWFKPNSDIYVPSLDEVTNTIVNKKVNHFYKQLVSEKLRTVYAASGIVSTTTKAHKYLTINGWTNNIKVGDYIALPKKELAQNVKQSVCDSSLIAWIISEGHCACGWTKKDGSKSSPFVRITQKNNFVADKIYKLAKKEGYSVTMTKDRHGLNVVNIYGLQKLLANGLKWELSNEKEIPKFIMQSDERELKKFIATYIDAEGHIQNGSRTTIEVSTASKTLAYQFSSILRKIGIASSVVSMLKCATNGTKIKREYFRITISGSSAKKLAKYCIPYSEVDYKISAMQELCNISINDNIETIYTQDVISKLYKMSGISRVKSDNLFANVYVNGSQKTMNSYTVIKLIKLIDGIIDGSVDSKPIDLKILEEMKLTLLNRISSEVYFVKVKKIEEEQYDGYVYDIEVEDNHNFIADNVMVHNTAMALSIALDKKYNNNFIMSPPHLVSKWADEIRKMYRSSEVNYKIVIVSRWEDLVPYTGRNLRKEGVKHFFIVSRETSKLSYKRVHAYNSKSKFIWKEELLDGETVEYKIREKIKVCPKCGNPIEEEIPDPSKKKPPFPYKCGYTVKNEDDEVVFECGEVLRDVDRSVSDRMRTRISVAEYIKAQWPKGMIDLLIIDEVHEYKGGDTGQGNAMAMIATRAKKIVGLTGTLLNGYASSLFYILYRLNPHKMKKELGLDYNQVKQFVQMYGAHEEIVEATETNHEGIVTKMGKRIALKEKPKISPYLLSLILDMTIFLRLDEIKMDEELTLPLYEESIETVEMDEEYSGAYYSYIHEITKRIRKDKRFLGNLAMDSLSIPDLPYGYHSAHGEVYYEPPVIRCEEDRETKEDILLPFTAKEKRLKEIVSNELEQGRKCLVYIHFSNKGVGDDINKILSEAFPNKRVLLLKPTIPAKKRQKYIEDNPSDILICNPELVKTGLDLLQFPTIIFYETGYNVFTLKQASRRSWRIGQRDDVKVIFMAYANSPQHKALQLIGAKVNAANSLEGRLSGDDDLSSIGEDDDNIQLALAKAIINGNTDVGDIELNKIENFGVREWDSFELYYNEILESQKVVDTESDKVVTLPIANNQDYKKESDSTPVEPQPKKSISIQLGFGFDDEDNADSEDQKITIYKRVKKGRRYVDVEMKVTRKEIDDMVASANEDESRQSIQLSLF